MRINFNADEAVQRVTGMPVDVLLEELDDAVKQAFSPYEDNRLWIGENVVCLVLSPSHGKSKTISMVLDQYPHTWDKSLIEKWVEKSRDSGEYAYYREFDSKFEVVKLVKYTLRLVVCTKERYDSEYASTDIAERARRAEEADDYSGISHYDSASDRGW